MEATMHEDTLRREQPVDRGIQDVLLEQVDLSDSHVQSEEDFTKVSKAEMLEGFAKLQSVVRPAVEKGANADYFSQMDEEQGLDYKNGYRKIYDAFYGDDAIRLDKVGDTYTVTNGYHRLAVAQELGLETIPARVIELQRVQEKGQTPSLGGEGEGIVATDSPMSASESEGEDRGYSYGY